MILELDIKKEENFPNLIKFIANEPFLEGKYEFTSPKQAAISPLASQLFGYYFVKKILIMSHFIIIEKQDEINWDEIEEQIQEMKEGIIRFLASQASLILEEKPQGTIYMEGTPNPDVLKFVLDKQITKEPIEITSSHEVYRSPLAEELFRFPFIKVVFLFKNAISITKKPHIEWDVVSSELKEFISDYIEEGKDIINKNSLLKEIPISKQSPIEKEIMALMDEYINPMVSQDGGNITLLGFDADTKTVKLMLQGACRGCPSSSITLKDGIEHLLKSKLPDHVSFVEAVDMG